MITVSYSKGRRIKKQVINGQTTPVSIMPIKEEEIIMVRR